LAFQADANSTVDAAIGFCHTQLLSTLCVFIVAKNVPVMPMTSTEFAPTGRNPIVKDAGILCVVYKEQEKKNVRTMEYQM